MSWTYSTTGHGMLGWKSSSSHWNIIVGNYSRVGCGGWASGSTYYYDCLFAKGGPTPSGLKSPPTRSPFSNPLPATPTPKPTTHPATRSAPQQDARSQTSDASGPTSGPAMTPDPWAGAAAVPLPISDAATVGATPPPGFGVAAIIQSANDAAPPVDGASGPAGMVARIVAVVSGSGAALLAGCYVFLSVRRRRRGGAASQ